MYAYQAAKVSRLQELSQPGNIPHRPALVGIHLSPPRNTVLHEMQAVSIFYKEESTVHRVRQTFS